MGVVVVTVLICLVCGVLSADVYVSGHYRSNGTYVAPYYRSNSDGNFYNNWSTYGNVNPYTGSWGTRQTPSYNNYGYGSYYRSNYSPYYSGRYYRGW
jgi:hypothetical protein